MTETVAAPTHVAERQAAPRTKLIEVALPLEAINKASAREKSIRHGHPSTLHLWWARRPLAACRAVLFAQLVDDPSAVPEEFPSEADQEIERQRLFRIIENLVPWESSTKEECLMPARREIARSVARGAAIPAPKTDDDVWRILREHAPPVLDPFCGGGSIPLEAQRLGLRAQGSDLNPVAVLITKALIEIPPKFAGRSPVNPEAGQRLTGGWHGAQGLAEDVRYYGTWMRDEAFKRIGHLYPKVRLPAERGGGEATVIAWLWARTVPCPNPACGARMPLIRSFALSTKKGKETWVEPVVDHEAKTVRFAVKTGKGEVPEGTKQRGRSTCLVCKTALSDSQLREQAKDHGMKEQLLAVVAEGGRSRVYLDPSKDESSRLAMLETHWLDEPMPKNPRWFSPPGYGMTTYRDLFTPRQLVALTTFSDLVSEARERVHRDAVAAGLPDDGAPLHEGGTGAAAYADAVSVYLSLALSRLTDICNALCRWEASKTQVRNLFGRQAIPMIWDFAEPNVFADGAGDFQVSLGNLLKALDRVPAEPEGLASQRDAASRKNGTACFMVSTDPPYYDNIGYADLSDFFYVWLRRSLRDVYPDLFGTLLVPKVDEMIASPYRFGGSKAKAEHFFRDGLGRAFDRVHESTSAAYPVSIYYAFKQSETDEAASDGGLAVSVSTGWETMLVGLLHAGFTILGTWPMRSELSNRMLASGTNALASSIVLVCRPRPEDAPIATRGEFLRALRRELPRALRTLQQGNIAPVDLAQATIGPGMAIFSRYSKVMEAGGDAMTVRTALGIINGALDEVLAEQESEYDPSTRWAVAWFE